MQRRHFTLLGLLVLAIPFVLYLQQRQGGRSQEKVGLAVERQSTSSSRAEPRAEFEDGADGVPSASDTESRTAVNLEDLALDGPPVDSASAVHVAGRLQLPAGLPADEEARVLAFGHAVEPMALGQPFQRSPATGVVSGLLAEARVRSGGDFRIALPAGADEVHLLAAGRYLYAAGSRRVDLRPPPEEVLLNVLLGARVEGTVVVPDGMSDAPGPTEVVLSVVSQGSLDQMDGSSLERRVTALRPDRTFVFDAVNAGRTVRVLAVPEGFAAAASEALVLRPGRVAETVIELGQGARIRGRVVDPEDRPVPGALVSVVQGANFLAGQPGQRVREAQTDAEGRFELEAVVAGVSSVRATLEEHLETSRRVDVSAGATLEDVELVLTRGGEIEGRVVWPSGTPVVGARVHAFFDMSGLGGLGGLNAIRGVEASTQSDAAGAFRVSGLGKGPFVLQVHALPENETGSEVEASSAGAELDPRRAWRARQEEVPPGRAGVVLELAPPLALEGRVVGAEGVAVEEFRATLMSESRGLIRGFGTEVIARDFEAPDGAFALFGLRPGNWELTVTAPGYGESAAISVTLPRSADASELEVLLLRAAAVAGRVVGPDGAPVTGARVSVKADSLHRMADAFHAIATPEIRSGEDGAFRLGGLAGGAVTLVAESDGLAASLPFTVELEPGGEHTEAVLKLRRGAILTGEVYDESGRPHAGVPVMLQITNTFDIRQAGTDVAGSFRFEGLEPGTWQVTSMPDEDSMAALMRDERGGLGGLIAGIRMRVVQLEEGEELHLVFGEPPPNPVRIHGRVTLDGDPVGDAVVSFMTREPTAGGMLQFEGTDRDGRYELLLESAGDYVMLVQRMGPVMAATTLELAQTVPETDEHEIDVALPAGRVSGRISGPRGEPVPGARITLVSVGEVPPGMFYGGQYSDLLSDDTGHYQVDWLAAGTYVLSAGGEAFGSINANPSPFGRSEGRTVELAEGEHARGVDFRLERAGEIHGTVRDASGRAVDKAAIFVRDEEGRTVERISWIQSDASGRFRCTSLRPGTYTVSARTDFGASARTDPVRVRGDETSEVSLTIEPGAFLVIETEDAKGEPLAATVTVRDSDGLEVQGLFSLTNIMRALQHGGIGELAQRVGPLLPGRYRIEGRVPDGRKAARTVTLRGQKERKVLLKLER